MSWASNAKKQLAMGREVVIYPKGNSMTPLVKSGEKVLVVPLNVNRKIKRGDIVLVTVKGNDYFHLVKAVDVDRYLIGNNHGRVNGWVSREAIHGIKQ